MSECTLELVHGNIDQKDFRLLQEQQIKSWYDSAYSRKKPVLNIGLQVWMKVFFMKADIWVFFSAFYGQRLVTAAWATASRSPWSIEDNVI